MDFCTFECGWPLSPAYDLNPVPVEVKPRILSTHITFDSGEASLALAFEVAEEFGLSNQQAKQIAHEVGHAVTQWREEATRLGLSAKMITRMESAFEHRDAEEALSSL